MSLLHSPSCALIITTYNWPAALKLVLQSVQHQTVPPDQLLVADDGSTDQTAALIRDFKGSMPNIVHCWQEDAGFRLARSRNNALAKVESDYVIIIDGDMLLEPNFLADHKCFAKNNCFVQGRRIMLQRDATDRLLNAGKFRWQTSELKSCVQQPHKLYRNPRIAKVLGYHQRNANDIRGCNMAFWQKDLISANGFDSEYVGWGREDSDLGWRLINAGLTKRHLRYSALALHLFHEERPRKALADNDRRLRRAKNDKSYIRCEQGVREIDS